MRGARWHGRRTEPHRHIGRNGFAQVHQQQVRITPGVEYPELRCNGYLHGAKLISGTLCITETITKNGSCVDEVPLELTLQDDNLRYHFDDGRRHGEGTGVLTRQR